MSEKQPTDKELANMIYAHITGNAGGNAFGLRKPPSPQQAEIERLQAEVKALRAKLAAAGDETSE